MQDIHPDPQILSPFLQLPPELRDLIYIQALPPTLSLSLSLSNSCPAPFLPLILVAFRKPRLVNDLRIPSTPAVKGLPSWLLASRLVLSEVARLIRREYAWMPLSGGLRQMERGEETLGWFIGHMVGTLVLRSVALGRVGQGEEMSEERNHYYVVEHQEKLALHILHSRGARLVELMMDCWFGRPYPEVEARTRVEYEMLKFWAERVKRVRVRFLSHMPSSDLANKEAKDIVERAVRWLVGDVDGTHDGVWIRWEEEIGRYKYNTRVPRTLWMDMRYILVVERSVN